MAPAALAAAGACTYLFPDEAAAAAAFPTVVSMARLRTLLPVQGLDQIDENA